MSRMKAEIPWRKRKSGVQQLDESRNPVEQEEKVVFMSRMKAEIPWRKRKRGVHQSDESRNPVEQEKKWCS
ncbi:hypothetical protein C2I17_06940 [Niallia circulans]|nr:hypothetical protein C2I17_06940 [Niallia circulans]